jgi:uncharacterized protein
VIEQNYVLDLSLSEAQSEGMTWWMLIVLAGGGVGFTFGVFGAGGSAFATPLLLLMGLPAPIAIASPLPAMLPASVMGAREYLRVGLLDRRVVKLAVVAGLPAVLAGAALSGFVGGTALIVLSGLLLFAVGVRMAWPVRPSSVSASPGRSMCDLVTPKRPVELVVGLVAGAGFLTGLLANGGGFLLVPIFVLVVGLTAAQAAGTSLVTVAALIVPTLAAHVVLGHVDWAVAGAFALGVIPASMVGARLGRRMPDAIARRAFGAVLVLFSVCFLVLRVS